MSEEKKNWIAIFIFLSGVIFSLRRTSSTKQYTECCLTLIKKPALYLLLDLSSSFRSHICLYILDSYASLPVCLSTHLGLRNLRSASLQWSELHCAPSTCIVHHQGWQCSSVPAYTLVVHNVALYWLDGAQCNAVSLAGLDQRSDWIIIHMWESIIVRESVIESHVITLW